jgi:Flp pilus assembly protein TadD
MPRRLSLFLALSMCAISALAGDGSSALHALDAGDARLALQIIERELETTPDDPALRFIRGVVLAELKRDDDAMHVYSALIEEYPGLAEPYNNLAVLQARRGDADQARVSLEAAVRNQPGHAVAQENLGDVYATLAARAWARAAETDPTRASALSKLAAIRELQARPGSATVPSPTTTAIR